MENIRTEKTQNGRWDWRTNPVRFWVTMALVVILTVTLGLAAGSLVDRADAAGPLRVDDTTDTTMAVPVCSTSGGDCVEVREKHRRNARKFRDGDIYRDPEGFRPRAVFNRKRHAKRTFIARIRGALYQRYGDAAPSARTESGGSCTVATRECAAEYWFKLQDTANCVTRLRPDYVSPVDPWQCRRGLYDGITKRHVQIGGAAIICGAQVAIGVYTGGASAAATKLLATAGGIGCGWGFRSSIS